MAKLNIYTVIDLLRNNSIELTGIKLQEPTQDEVFLTLTGKSPPEHSSPSKPVKP